MGTHITADVPVFIQGKTAFAEGIGEKLQALEVDEQWYLVVNPNVHISTAEIFASSYFNPSTKPAPTATTFWKELRKISKVQVLTRHTL